MPYNSRLITYTRSGSAFLGHLLSNDERLKIAMGSHNLKTLRDGETLITVIRNPLDVLASSIINELPTIKDFDDFCHGQILGYKIFHEKVLSLKNKIIIDFDKLVSDPFDQIYKVTVMLGCLDYEMPEYNSVRLESNGHVHSSREHEFYNKALDIAKSHDLSYAIALHKECLKFSI